MFTKGKLEEIQTCCNCIDLLSKEDGKIVAQIMECDDDELSNTQIANAKELVRRWNSHDDLLEACKVCRATFIGLQQGSIGYQAMQKVNTAIASVGD